ncbi:MAG: PLDc_N domain-containing protein [Rhodospirillales bacterium]|nr:PLDc_N domain-containing protein [Rhodospirillales bacterium]
MSDYGGIFGLIVLALDIWAIINIVQSGISTGAKVLWVLLIIILPLVGVIIWFFAGPRGGRAAA